MEQYDEGEHVKETFAHFGRAYYMSNVFEAGLAIAVMQLDFLTQIKVKFIRDGRKGFDRSKYEADFDKFMDTQHAQSLGNLIKTASKFDVFDIDFKNSISELKSKRDFLAHHFFRERSVEFASRRGRDSMIAELENAHLIFERADRRLDLIMKPVRHELGFDEQMLAALHEKLLEEAQSQE